jgi:hypothetical protein
VGDLGLISAQFQRTELDVFPSHGYPFVEVFVSQEVVAERWR